jgi:hypothetical protein
MNSESVKELGVVRNNRFCIEGCGSFNGIACPPSAFANRTQPFADATKNNPRTKQEKPTQIKLPRKLQTQVFFFLRRQTTLSNNE